jgi:hypothetical protein
MSNRVLQSGMTGTEATHAAQVEVFDPPMCCSSGVCGPAVDIGLLDVNAMFLTLQEEGVAVQRYQMSSDLQAFLRNPEVLRLIRERQMAALPITLVKGSVLTVGAYPSLSEIRNALNGGSH